MKALITGITGQDGSILAKKLIQKGYEVHGTLRPSSNPNYSNLGTSRNFVQYHYCDLTDSGSVDRVVGTVKPDHIYNFAAQSSVSISQTTVDYTANVTGLGALRLLDANSKLSTPAKFFQASSIEIENASNVYGAAKLFAHNMVENYRNRFDTNIAVFSNHESAVRPNTFVTRKVIDAVIGIFEGTQHELKLGDTSMLRDWGWAPEYMDGVIQMMSQSGSDTLTFATGVRMSLQEFVDAAFSLIGMKSSDFLVTTPGLAHTVNHTPALLEDVEITELRLGWRPKIVGRRVVEEMFKGVCNNDH